MAHCQQGLESLGVLVTKLEEILKYRVDANLATLAQGRLLDLPADHTFACDEFLAAQTAFSGHQADSLAKR